MTAMWTTRDGRRIPVSEMADTHLCNTIQYLRRRKDALTKEIGHSITLAGGEDVDAADADVEMEIFDMKTPEEVFPVLNDMYKEADRRQLAYKLWCVTCQQFHRPTQTKCVEAFCKNCQKWHPSPVNDFHRRALGCKTITSSAP